MRRAQYPDLRMYMDKRLHLKLSGGRHMTGILRAYDKYMHLVIDEAVEFENGATKNIGKIVIPGSSVVFLKLFKELSSY